MKKALFFLISFLLFSCTDKGKSKPFEVIIEQVITDQYPEGADFPGFIMFDIRIENRSDSILTFSVLNNSPYPNKMEVPEKGIYIRYNNDKLALSPWFVEKDNLVLQPYNFIVGRFAFLGNTIYEKKYQKLYPTYREFSKDFVSNAVLYFISYQGDTVVVKNDKPLQFEGDPGEIECGWITLYPLRQGKISPPK